jgi:tetratricopeptide (TPR) repeat protein
LNLKSLALCCLSGLVVWAAGCKETSPQAQEQKSSTGTPGSVRVQQILSPEANLGEVVASLQSERDSLPPKEREVIGRLIQIIEGLMAHPEDFEAAFSGQQKLLRELGSLVPDDFEAQLVIASSFHLQVATATNLERNNAPILEEAVRVARALTKKFEKEPRAWAHLGYVLMMNKGDPREAQRMFRKCLALDSESALCRDYAAENNATP